MVLRDMQSLLGRLYDVEQPYDVYDFLVTDRRAVAGCAPQNQPHSTEEELLLAESVDAGGSQSAGVALYLHPDVLRRLEQADPNQALTEDNLADYCTALEGVSHFVYSTWRLDCDLPVSLLELETQAEVDKYAITVFLVARQWGGTSFPQHVHARLFDRVSFDTRLEPFQYERYRTAHTLAARYCRRLEHRFVSRGKARVEAMVRELRSFYRLGSAAKLRHAMA
jgi:hypothetical protein